MSGATLISCLQGSEDEAHEFNPEQAVFLA